MNGEPLMFDFGTTPEEVIRERLAWFFDEVVINKYDSCAPCPPVLNGNTTHPDARDDLLTVLDELAAGAHRAEKDEGKMYSFTRPGRLRIEILAALGIKEG